MPNPEDLDYLDTAEAGSGVHAAIEGIEKAANELDRIDEELYLIDKKQRGLKQRKEYIARTLLPSLMGGSTVIETDSGLKVTSRRFLYVTIKDKEKLVKFLESRGDSDLMETSLRIKRLPKEARSAIRDFVVEQGGFVSKIDTSLHHSTQRKYFNELLTEHPEIQDQIDFGEVKDYFETKYSRNNGGIGV